MKIEDYIFPFLKYYKSFPTWIRYLFGRIYRLIPFRWRYGNTYTFYSKLLKKSSFWSSEVKDRNIINLLKDTLINAYENTEYYNELFTKIKFNPYSFSVLDDIKKIPFSNKEIIRNNKKTILNKNMSMSELIYVTTGGTSGIPVELYYIKGRERSRELVFMTNQWKRIGYQYNDRIAVLRGSVISDNRKNILFNYEPVKNRLFLSTYDLYESNFPLYINKLREFKPKFIHTYPSAITVLAKYISENKIKLTGIKGLFCSSEQFYPGQRELIEEAFGARVYSWYGHSEYAVLGGECELSNDYHIFHEYGYFELLDDDGNIISEPGIQGEIVGTSFEMKGFPIIRYRTGDYAEYSQHKCDCGRNYSLIKNVNGRWQQEKLITKKNSYISITALNMHTDIFDNVIQYQFYQNQPGNVYLRIIRNSKYNLNDEIKIKNSFTNKLKDLIDFEIVYVDRINRTERGKHKFLIQELE